MTSFAPQHARLRRFNVDEYQRLGEIGVLARGVELLDGVVYDLGVDRPHRFTVEDVERMIEAGVLGPDDRIELLGGALVTMTPIGRRHQACVDWLVDFFA